MVNYTNNKIVINNNVDDDLEKIFDKMADAYFDKVLIEDCNMPEHEATHNRLSYFLGLKTGANWQKHKDQKTIELAEEHALLAGRMQMKEEMMKNAIDGEMKDIEENGLVSKSLKYNGDELQEALNKIEVGDKVKLIIVKED